MNRLPLFNLSVLAQFVLLFGAATAAADDWPQWGGPKRDLVWREADIVDRLPAGKVLPRMWSTPIGEGYAGPAVANGRVYLADRIKDQGLERVLCLNAETGKVIWKHQYPAKYTVDYPAGPRMTPLVDGDLVYTIGTMGHMFCLKTADGSVVWKKQFVDEFDTRLPIWGMVATPLIIGNQLITLVGGTPNALVVCFDKQTGDELWRSLEDTDVGYCPPLLCEFGGKAQVVVWHPKSVSAIDPADGRLIWDVPFKVNFGLCIPQPRQVGNRLFVTAFYNGPLMLEIAEDGASAKIVWKGKSSSEVRTDGLHSIMSTPIFDGKNIYGVCSYGQLRGLDATNGERLWETREPTGEGRWWNAFLVPHEDRVFLHNEQGDLIIAKLTPAGYEEISRAQLVEPTRDVNGRMTIWSHPAFAMQSVFARNDRVLVRVDLKKKP
ncbi:MAG: pyrrolo-quinoline quinone [Planctomycetaceae bacterium]|nr:MAG: pyrrolo-quinoline quinone [Planctomycetaceae bacterium]